MATEIERKFLVEGTAWRQLGQKYRIIQGFLSTHPERVVRVRLIENSAFLTIKGIAEASARKEFEYPIPAEDAEIILKEICESPLIEKVRYKIPIGNVIWEIDEFKGENEGLVLAEVELRDKDQKIELPEWIKEEVTGDPKYANANLVHYPYSKWRSC